MYKARSVIHLKTLKFPVIFLKTLNLGGHPPTPGGVSMSLVPPYIAIFFAPTARFEVFEPFFEVSRCFGTICILPIFSEIIV